jgi:hypothetical protein
MHTVNVFSKLSIPLLHPHILLSPLPNDADIICILSLPQSRINGGGVEYFRRKLIVVILVLDGLVKSVRGKWGVVDNSELLLNKNGVSKGFSETIGKFVDEIKGKLLPIPLVGS